jgi:hypothetical protein
LPAKADLQAAKFLGKVVGSFLQVVAVSMNWCRSHLIDSLFPVTANSVTGRGSPSIVRRIKRHQFGVFYRLCFMVAVRGALSSAPGA